MDWLNLLAGVIHVTIIVTCVIGNSITIAAIARCKMFCTPFHTYLLNISISDMMVMIFSATFLVENISKEGFIFGDVVCKLGMTCRFYIFTEEEIYSRCSSELISQATSFRVA